MLADWRVCGGGFRRILSLFTFFRLLMCEIWVNGSNYYISINNQSPQAQSMRNRTTFMDRQKKISQPPSYGCPNIHPCISTPTPPPMSQAEFNYDYSQYTRDLPIVGEVKDNLKYLYELYCCVAEGGGLVAMMEDNRFGGLIGRLGGKFPEICNLAPENIIEHYIKYELFSFQIVLKSNKKFPNDKLSCLHLAKFIAKNDVYSYLSDPAKGLQLFNNDIVLLEQLAAVLSLDESQYGLKNVGNRYGNEMVRVFVQEGDLRDGLRNNLGEEFCDKEGCSRNLTFAKIKDRTEKKGFEQIQMLAREYFNYLGLQNVQERNQFIRSKFSSRSLQDQSNRLLYAFQFDPKDQHLLSTLYNKIKDTFLSYKQKHDLLSYNDEDIIGITFPRFRMQAEGNWAGGCQQTYGMAMVDINFGPDSSEWYCVSAENLNKFHSVFKAEYGINAEAIQGEWFEDIDWFLQRKIPIKKLIQKKGDAVITGAGSLCWHKSKGKGLHVSWNMMIKSDKQIMASINKYIRIKQLSAGETGNCRWHSKMPLKTIFLRALNHQQSTFLPKIGKKDEISSTSLVIVREWLKKWTTEQQKFLNQMIVRQDVRGCRYKQYYLFDAQSFCSHCNSEILNYFVNCNGLCCLECCSKQFLSRKVTQLKDKNLYYKYEPFWLHQLIYYGNCRNVSEGQFCQYEELCKGEFIGNVADCSRRAERQKQIGVQSVVVDGDTEWSQLIEEYDEQMRGSLEIAQIYKLETLMGKNSGVQMTNFGPNSYEIQTKLSLICQETDQQIESLLIQTKANKIKKALTSSDDKNHYNRELTSRKERRQQFRRQGSQKSETQCTEQLSDGNFTFGEAKMHSRRSQSITYDEKEENNGNSRAWRREMDFQSRKRHRDDKTESYWRNDRRDRDRNSQRGQDRSQRRRHQRRPQQRESIQRGKYSEREPKVHYERREREQREQNYPQYRRKY